MKLGHYNIYALSDGGFALDGGQMFGVVPKPLWEKQLAADARNRVPLALTCLLIQTGRHNILIETGIGDRFDARRKDIYAVDHSAASLPGELKKVGASPEEIDIVINTHLHFDHCGWNTRVDGGSIVPTFPRARYFVQRGEWEHACAPTERDRGSFVEEFFAPVKAQTELLEGDAEILPGIRLEVLPGHTRHMQGVRITSEGEQAYFISDLVPTTAHLRYAWMMGFDLYPLETLASKKRLLPELADGRTLVVFPHDRSTPWARLEEREGEVSAVIDPSAG